MKVSIEIDVTPQEMRTLMGLPDIEPMQQQMMEQIREKTLAGIDAKTPAELMQLLFPTADQLNSMELFQAQFWQGLGKVGDLTGGNDEK